MKNKLNFFSDLLFLIGVVFLLVEASLSLSFYLSGTDFPKYVSIILDSCALVSMLGSIGLSVTDKKEEK